ncbi:MAG: sugar ABC transporter permease, partial [Alphaproteobacteria bacterium]|nr:sugar ABC transporter permease [Alphaproteobacteria bacterium]
MWLPLLVNAAYVVGFTAWTTWLSFTPSDLLPEYEWVGLRSFRAVLRSENTEVAYINLVIYGTGYVALTMLLGFVLAVLIDQRIRAENLLRTVFLYPLAVSFVVTGSVWSWLFNPGLGVQKFVRDLGWSDFRFDWIVDRDMALYTIIIAAAWHGAGFAMALFLAGLRSIDSDIAKAAQIDGAGPVRFYLRIAAPSMAPIAIAGLVILLQYAIKTFDLVRALTNGGPGISTALPALVVYDFMFQR